MKISRVSLHLNFLLLVVPMLVRSGNERRGLLLMIFCWSARGSTRARIQLFPTSKNQATSGRELQPILQQVRRQLGPRRERIIIVSSVGTRWTTWSANYVARTKLQLGREAVVAMRMMSSKELMRFSSITIRRNSLWSMLGRNCETTRSGVKCQVLKRQEPLGKGSVKTVQTHRPLNHLRTSVPRVLKHQRPLGRRLWVKRIQWIGFKVCGTLNRRSWKWRKGCRRWVYLTLLLQRKNL